MKKSQMVAAIEEVLRDSYLLSFTEQARLVVQKAEELGMKPPVVVHDVLYTKEFVWENEDVKC